MSTAVAEKQGPGVVEQVVLQGDLSRLSPDDRVRYYAQVCESLGLNPLTQPFQYLTLNNRLVLYARKDATDQLRRLHRVSVTIAARERHEDVYVVTARATLPDGRADESIGAVSISGLKGEHLANALMKSESKAKRRVTLSICGLGMLDETEVDGVGPPAAPPAPPRPPAGNGHKSPPETGRDLADRLAAWEKALVDARVCKAGDLLSHVRNAGAVIGREGDPASWDAAGVAAGWQAAAEYDRDAWRRAINQARQEAKPPRAWPEVMRGLKLPPDTAPDALTRAQRQEALRLLREEVAPAAAREGAGRA